ncbi:MAG: hypothetical protein IKF05_00465 [Erysipelotrichaceae bacterium]|nr:hypothetical protein [Erysipelotrichaceae bacterium]
MKYLWILSIVLSLTGISPDRFSLVSYVRESIQRELEKAGAELHHEGTRTSVTTRNMWISVNEENNLWVVDVQGTPKEVYIVDSPEREEISHYERVHHEAVTHQEPVYGERRYWTVTFPAASSVFAPETYYSYEEALSAAGARDGNIVNAAGDIERYIVSYNTVVDREAYDETVKVIDQYARAEVGHYETKILGEIGHWEQGNAELAGIGEGHYISKMIRSGAEQ